MSNVLISDIFGHTKHLNKLIQELGQDFKIISPYQSPKYFESEDVAYSSFLESGGVATYTNKIKSELSSFSNINTIVGFSAGASVLWNLLEDANASMNKAICFYGGQIVSNLKINPRFNNFHVICKSESQYHYQDIISELSTKASTSFEVTDYQHGFMNPQSPGYDSSGYRFYRDWLVGELKF